MQTEELSGCRVYQVKVTWEKMTYWPLRLCVRLGRAGSSESALQTITIAVKVSSSGRLTRHQGIRAERLYGCWVNIFESDTKVCTLLKPGQSFDPSSYIRFSCDGEEDGPTEPLFDFRYVVTKGGTSSGRSSQSYLLCRDEELFRLVLPQEVHLYREVQRIDLSDHRKVQKSLVFSRLAEAEHAILAPVENDTVKARREKKDEKFNAQNPEVRPRGRPKRKNAIDPTLVSPG